MSRLLEIFGRGLEFDTAELIWSSLDTAASAQDKASDKEARRLDEALDLVRRRKVESAEQQLRLYLFDHPNCLRGRLAAAAICISKSQLNEALQELNSVYMRQPNNTMALYALGHCCERLGREAEAIEFYQDCLKFKNYLEFPRQRLAAIYFKNNQLEKTLNEYQSLADEYPDRISTLLILGHLYITTGDFARANQTFDKAILMHPDNFAAADDTDDLIAQGLLDEALQRIEQLLDLDPHRLDLVIKRADLLGMLGAATDAVAQYQQALRLCPDFLEARIKLGTRYLQLNWVNLAAQQFNRAAEINDQIVDAYTGLAVAEKLDGRDAQATSTLSLAAAIQPNSALLFAQTAILQFKTSLAKDSDRWHNAADEDVMRAVLQTHRRQLESRPNNPDLHYRLGVLLLSAAQMDDAATCFSNALRLNPTYARARTKLAVCLFETAHAAAALEQIATPAPLDHQTLQLHYNTALLYCDRPRFASSLLNLERYLEENFACPDATVNVSIVLQNLGLLDRAQAMWENLFDSSQNVIACDHHA